MAWTLYQWWAVIGWPEGAGGVYAAGVLGVGLGLAGWDVSRELRAATPGAADPAHSRRAAAVVPFPVRPRSALAASVEDRAA
jgi:hypothetical protein